MVKFGFLHVLIWHHYFLLRPLVPLQQTAPGRGAVSHCKTPAATSTTSSPAVTPAFVTYCSYLPPLHSVDVGFKSIK